MASKRAGKQSDAAAEPIKVEPTKASREKDKEPGPVTFRVDLGESIPVDQPIRTATDNE